MREQDREQYHFFHMSLLPERRAEAGFRPRDWLAPTASRTMNPRPKGLTSARSFENLLAVKFVHAFTLTA